MLSGRLLCGLFLTLAAGLLASCSARRGFEVALIPPGLALLANRPAVSTLAISDAHHTVIDAERVQLTREYFALHHLELAASLPAGDKPEVIAFTPQVVVVHYTAYPTLESSLAVFAPTRIDAGRGLVAANGALNVGIQFVVDRDGTIYRLYPETAMSRHVIGLNHVAIGIENVGDGDLDEASASAPLTQEQLAANLALVRDLVSRHPTIRLLIGHSEYRDLEDPRHPGFGLFVEAVPGYRTTKVDPGPRFMRALRKELSEQRSAGR